MPNCLIKLHFLVLQVELPGWNNMSLDHSFLILKEKGEKKGGGIIDHQRVYSV